MLYYCCIINELLLSFCVGNFNCIDFNMNNFATFNLVDLSVNHKIRILRTI